MEMYATRDGKKLKILLYAIRKTEIGDYIKVNPISSYSSGYTKVSKIRTTKAHSFIIEHDETWGDGTKVHETVKYPNVLPIKVSWEDIDQY